MALRGAAGTPPDTEKRTAEIVPLRRRVGDLETQVSVLQGKLAVSEREVGRLSGALVKTQKALAKAERALAKVRDKLAKAMETLRERAHQLFGRHSERGPVPGGGGHGGGEHSGRPAPTDGQNTPRGNDASTRSGGPGQPPDAPKVKRGARRGHIGAGRHIDERLPHVDQVHTLAADQLQCEHCHGTFEPIPGSFATSRVMDWAVFVFYAVHKRQRYIHKCPCDGQKHFRTASPAPKVIRKGMVSARFLARMCVEKFWLGRPLHRLHAGLSLEVPDLPVTPGGLTRMLKNLQPLLAPLYEAIRERVRTQTLVAADETTMTVLDPWPEKGKADKADAGAKADASADKADGAAKGQAGSWRWWVWCFKAADAVAFKVVNTREAKVVFDFFGWDSTQPPPASHHLILLTDCFSGYKKVCGWILSAYCWAHMRRRFVKAAITVATPAARQWAEAWRGRIRELYDLDRQRRQAEAESPVWVRADAQLRACLAAIHSVAEQQRSEGNLGPAQLLVINSLLRHWGGLTVFLDNPAVALDNNEVERILRTVVVGRKNYLFFSKEWSATVAGMLWSIFATATRNGLNPLHYLTAYLQACAENGGQPLSGEALERFLPWALAAEDKRAWSEPLPMDPLPGALIPGTPAPQRGVNRARRLAMSAQAPQPQVVNSS